METDIREPQAPAPAAPDEPDEMTPDEAVQAALASDCQQRLWLRALVPLLALRKPDSGPQTLAFDLMYAAAADRVCRLCRSDLDVD